ncbi:hypothetical protein AAG906_038209 [Vitis piasezkii]
MLIVLQLLGSGQQACIELILVICEIFLVYRVSTTADSSQDWVHISHGRLQVDSVNWKCLPLSEWIYCSILTKTQVKTNTACLHNLGHCWVPDSRSNIEMDLYPRKSNGSNISGLAAGASEASL